VEQVEQVPLLEEQVEVEELYVQDHKHRLVQAEQEVQEHLTVLQEQLQHTLAEVVEVFIHQVQHQEVQEELVEVEQVDQVEDQAHLQVQEQQEQLTLEVVVEDHLLMMLALILEQELQAVQES